MKTKLIEKWYRLKQSKCMSVAEMKWNEMKRKENKNKRSSKSEEFVLSWNDLKWNEK